MVQRDGLSCGRTRSYLLRDPSGYRQWHVPLMLLQQLSVEEVTPYVSAGKSGRLAAYVTKRTKAFSSQ